MLAVAIVVLAAQPAAAIDKTGGEKLSGDKLSEKKLAIKECGACHYFYPSKYLPAYSWKKIIDNLDNHFGEDASLDETSRKRVLSYMVGNRSVEIPIRITKTSWWKQIHGPRILASAKKRNMPVAECDKCHR